MKRLMLWVLGMALAGVFCLPYGLHARKAVAEDEGTEEVRPAKKAVIESVDEDEPVKKPVHKKKVVEEDEEAGGMRAGVFGGWTTVSMNKVNSELDDMTSGIPGVSVTHATSGWVVGADMEWGITPNFFLGPRIEYILGVEAKGTATISGQTGTITGDANLIPVMVGGKLEKFLPKSGMTIGGFLYTGIGFGSGLLTATQPGYSGSVGVAGSNLIFELGGNLKWELSEGFSLGGDLAFRAADIATMKVTSVSNNMLGAKVGDTAEDSHNNPIDYDFSGILLGIHATFMF